MSVSFHRWHLKAVGVSARLLISSRLLSKLCPKRLCINSSLEIAESHRFPHEYITVDIFFITDGMCEQGGSELDPSSDSEDKVFTVG